MIFSAGQNRYGYDGKKSILIALSFQNGMAIVVLCKFMQYISVTSDLPQQKRSKCISEVINFTLNIFTPTD